MLLNKFDMIIIIIFIVLSIIIIFLLNRHIINYQKKDNLSIYEEIYNV
jgi:preprotein translocase subunit SecG